MPGRKGQVLNKRSERLVEKIQSPLPGSEEDIIIINENDLQTKLSMHNTVGDVPLTNIS